MPLKQGTNLRRVHTMLLGNRIDGFNPWIASSPTLSLNAAPYTFRFDALIAFSLPDNKLKPLSQIWGPL
ncbi:hypothetical protein AFERRI_30153 [Acidithiobacillus ferrivorans]|uniref:Uncharacterized protein n=1 Tax=Acidithiobacillus ferrivorans TaxID=160808 RepID=A0A060ULK2_9PROT|nr:hypothetical protein AFERRI_30153 [Acidithiobacillus ferrivorans]